MEPTEQQELYSNSYLKVIQNRYKKDNIEFDRIFMNLENDGVLIIPRTSDGRYILIKQSRLGVEEETYEFPSGGVEPGEDFESAAHRELQEEIGGTGTFTYIGSYQPLPAFVRLVVQVYLAENVIVDETLVSQDIHEDIRYEMMTNEQLVDKIRTGEINKSNILSSLYLLQVKESP